MGAIYLQRFTALIYQILAVTRGPATVTLTNKDMSLRLLWPPQSSVIATGSTCSWETYRPEMASGKRPRSNVCYLCIHMCFYSRFLLRQKTSSLQRRMFVSEQQIHIYHYAKP